MEEWRAAASGGARRQRVVRRVVSRWRLQGEVSLFLLELPSEACYEPSWGGACGERCARSIYFRSTIGWYAGLWRAGACGGRFAFSHRCRNVAHVSQSRPDSGLDFQQVKVVHMFRRVPFSLGNKAHSSIHVRSNHYLRVARTETSHASLQV